MPGFDEFRDRAMPFFAYLVILVVAVFSIGLEWQTLVEPSGATLRDMRAVSELGKAPAQPDAAEAQPAAVEQTPQPKAAAVAPPQATQEALAEKTAAPLCDVAACAAAYRTFRASDCSYVPSLGERRLCTKGTPPAAVEAQATGAPPPKCNVEACRAAYFTFNPADCTYQPTDGPRRLCEK